LWPSGRGLTVSARTCGWPTSARRSGTLSRIISVIRTLLQTFSSACYVPNRRGYKAMVLSDVCRVHHEYSWSPQLLEARRAGRRRRKACMGCSWAAACGVQGRGHIVRPRAQLVENVFVFSVQVQLAL